MFGLTLAVVVLAIGPFIAPPGSVSSPGTARFSVKVSGRSGQIVHLRALGVPSGYIASFCTRRVCAPFHVSFALPRAGRESIELQLIENVPGAREPASVTVAADGARAVSIAFSSAR